ncbi:MAG TPA: 16S rRNA (cytosine(967)-C(5))-methyltransferase RsmB [Methylomirabilota bacterium]|nr:16S rRNA (cytosine(967)-C(5))-methyltransferase RsmB [Methylomirabilota bacterium]
MTVEKPREIALRLLLRRTAGKDYVENLLDAELAGSRLSGADRGLLQELAYGVVRWQATLDWLIGRKTSGRTQKPGLQILLQLALYQMFWLSRIPDHAAVNETVEMAKRQGFGQQAGFVNAVLRGYLRERAQTEQLLQDLKCNDLALGYSHPKWLCERWEKTYGRENLVRLLEWNNTPPAIYARVNTLRADANKLREQWAQEKVEAKLVSTEWGGHALTYELQSFPSLATLKSFNDGWFYVQDPSTLLAVAELNPQPGETVLDYCSAPGGKTTFIAERTGNSGRLVAHDTSPDRIELVEENCARLGVTCVQTALPSTLDSQLPTQVDRILVDAPCSNTGVMRRRVDLRWRIRAPEIARLCATQLELLRAAARWLKPGGTLVYSTCSLEPEENSGVVRELLKENPALHFQRERTLTPWEHSVDGAYVARFVRGA